MDRASIAALAALDEDLRRELFEYVRGAGEPVTREAAGAAVGISRKLAAFHLDKLVDLGLLQSGFASGGTRRVGRAPRTYEPAAIDVCVRIPARSPELLAEILLEAVTDESSGERARRSAHRLARARGKALGARARASVRGGRLGAERALTLSEGLLAEAGFEPFRAGTGLRMRNCPFHPLAAQSPQFVCGLNREYVAGLVEGLDAADRVVAELAPRPGECCVELRPA